MKNKKGFTLIELLAVIVVLAIIMVIATGSVVKVIENARASAFLSSYEMVLKTVKNNVAMANMGMLNVDDITCSSDCYDKYGIDNTEYEMKVVASGAGGYELLFSGKGKFEKINISNEKLPVNVYSYGTNDKDKINTLSVRINSSGQDISYAKEEISEKDLLIEYSNELIKVAKAYMNKEGDVEAKKAAAKAVYNNNYMDGDGAFSNQYCSLGGTLISIKRKGTKYDDANMKLKNIGAIGDNRICYYSKNAANPNNTIMTCVNEEGSIYKPEPKSNSGIILCY